MRMMGAFFSWFKWFLSRTGVLYFAVFFLLLFLVDRGAVLSRFRARNLNDARPSMTELVSFNKGQLAPDKVDWTPYLDYFALVLKYAPHEEVSAMFLGVCEYYAGKSKADALAHVSRSAETNPFLFWNIYNAGVLALAKGDMRAAAGYFEKALVIPEDKIFLVMKSSTVYRQVMAAGNFNADIDGNVRRAKRGVYLFLAAASFHAGDIEKARNIAGYALKDALPEDREPLMFYAAAAEFSLGRVPEAFVLLSQCIELRSTNPMVYRYAARILKAAGKDKSADDMLRTAKSFGIGDENAFSYPDRLRPAFF